MTINEVCIYLRKSRKDLEIETREGIKVLDKHEKILIDLASKKGYSVKKLRKEIASGDSLAYRPQMVKLLEEVNAGCYDGIMCMDLDRLGRGDMEEQGVILKSLRKNNTKIITPHKVYDLSNEWDEEYSEFEAFMARKELKLITRRLQRGRIKSIEEGNYLAPRAPYGYRIEKEKGERYLVAVEPEASVIQQIFDWYTEKFLEKRLGAGEIASRLNSLEYDSPEGRKWNKGTVLFILKNPVYTGIIRWGSNNETIEVEGKHSPLISKECFDRAQAIMKEKNNSKSYRSKYLTNPLAGLVICSLCRRSMVYRPYSGGREPHLTCYNSQCENKSAKYKHVEKKLLIVLEKWLEGYERIFKNYLKTKPNKKLKQKSASKISLGKIKERLKELKVQKENIHDLLEKGIYSDEVFFNRSRQIESKIKILSRYYRELKQEQKSQENDCDKNLTSSISQDYMGNHIIKIFRDGKNADDKNFFLKSILKRVEYKKEKSQKEDEFQLIVYPKLDCINEEFNKYVDKESSELK